jgi:hypothetical protein
MKLNRPSVPIGLPISAIILLVLGYFAGPIIESITTEEQRATNVLLSAIPFVLIFVSIILFYIILIWLVATALNEKVPPTIYNIIERLTIAGIVLGIIGMFQPWVFSAYKYGFLLLLLSTLAFILWSHITPAATSQEEELGALSLSDFEQRQSQT